MGAFLGGLLVATVLYIHGDYLGGSLERIAKALETHVQCEKKP